jgi:hypothetical protein
MGPAAVPEEEIAKIAKTEEEAAGFRAFLEKSAREIKEVHPNGLHNTLKDLFEEEEDFQVRVALLEEPECGLTEEVLDNTDVLVWWAHIAHDKVPDAIAQRVKDHVLKGMGIDAKALTSEDALPLSPERVKQLLASPPGEAAAGRLVTDRRVWLAALAETEANLPAGTRCLLRLDGAEDPLPAISEACEGSALLLRLEDAEPLYRLRFVEGSLILG